MNYRVCVSEVVFSAHSPSESGQPPLTPSLFFSLFLGMFPGFFSGFFPALVYLFLSLLPLRKTLCEVGFPLRKIYFFLLRLFFMLLNPPVV